MNYGAHAIIELINERSSVTNTEVPKEPEI